MQGSEREKDKERERKRKPPREIKWKKHNRKINRHGKKEKKKAPLMSGRTSSTAARHQAKHETTSWADQCSDMKQRYLAKKQMATFSKVRAQLYLLEPSLGASSFCWDFVPVAFQLLLMPPTV